MRLIAKRVKAAVVIATESKLDGAIFDQEIHTENHEILHGDTNRDGGVVFATSKVTSIYFKLSTETENSTFDILMEHSKPIKMGIPESG